jgi:hypothetical protein
MYAIVDAHGHRLASEPDVVRRLGVKIDAYQSDNIVFKQSASSSNSLPRPPRRAPARIACATPEPARQMV